MRTVTRGFGLLENLLAGKRQKKADSLIPRERRRGRILDIGCGTEPYFLLKTDFREKHGMDTAVSPEVVKTGKKKNLQLINHDIALSGVIPFGDGYFDVVTMLAVFEHIDVDKIGIVTKEIRRVLKDDGLFVFTTPAGWTDPLLRFLAKIRIVSAEEIADHKDRYNHRKIRSILESAGFEREKTTLGHFELFMNIWGAAVK